MAKQNRQTLRNFFADGALPSAGQFGELIDSTLNMKDEGFNKSVEHGFEISTRGNSTGLVSFFRDSEPLSPLWSIRLDENDQQNLTFTGPVDKAAQHEVTDDSNAGDLSEVAPLLTLSTSGWVGVNTVSPGCDLDINGTMRCATRLGATPPRQVTNSSDNEKEHILVDQTTPVLADGEWHNITTALTGCQALEVVAGVGKKDHGRYALLHTIALNTFNPKGWVFNFFKRKNRIKCQHAYYRSRSDKLALRWAGEERRYFLQIRTNGNYGRGAHGEPIRINYHVTRLWTDPRMTESWDVEKQR